MGKRFDAYSVPLLKLMGHSKCLDDLLVIEPKPPKEYFDFEEIARPAQREKRRLNAFEQILVDPIRPIVNQYFAESAPYVKAKDVLFLPHDKQTAYDDILDTFPLFGPAMDTLFSAKQPTAYYMPSGTAQTVLETKLMLHDKMAHLIHDLPTETGLLILDKIEGLDFKDMVIAYHADKSQVSGLVTMYSRELQKVIAIDVFHIDFKDITQIINTGTTVATVMFFVLALLFIHFFETEKVIAVQPTANTHRYARAELNGEKYDSNLTYPVNVVDAHWYTTIIRDDPFLVKGHFRKQPYGPGRSQYKVRWISAFMKQGYHRQAKTA